MSVTYQRHGRAIYRTAQWKAVRHQAKRRDGWACVKCGARGRLEVDHITPLRDGGAPYDLSNLQSLCAKCHSRKTRLEVGLQYQQSSDPQRRAWKSLLRDMRQSSKGTKHA